MAYMTLLLCGDMTELTEFDSRIRFLAEVMLLSYTARIMQKLMLVLMTGMWVMPAVADGLSALPVEPRATHATGKNLWRVSVVTLAAANVLDAHSSWGKHELNPNLSGNNGSFGREGALLKLGIVGGLIVVESLVLHNRPSAKFRRGLALINFGSASVTGAMAIRNFGIPRQ
jgi:hypothetical protein